MSLCYTTPRERAVRDWEQRVLRPMDRATVDLATARAVVSHLHAAYGLPGKPVNVVECTDPDSPEYVPGAAAYVNHGGTRIVLQQRCSTVILLHEFAHVLTDDPLDSLELRQPVEREMHGDVFLSNFVDLLDRFMGPRFNKGYLMHTLQGLPVRPAWAANPYHTRS